jgi:hypothetical protein
MTINDAETLIHLGYIDRNQSDFENAKSLGIDFNSGTWATDFIVKCISEGKGLAHAELVIDFLRGAKLGCHGTMTHQRAQLLRGVALGLSMVKNGKVNFEQNKGGA